MTLSHLGTFFQVIPPGMDFSNVVAQEDSAEADGDLAAIISTDGASPKSVPPIWSEVSYINRTNFIFEFFVRPNLS